MEKEELWPLFERLMKESELREEVRKDPLKTAFYGAGMAAAGFVLVTLVDETRGDASPGSGGGKDPIPPP